jgi:hypothetical protein
VSHSSGLDSAYIHLLERQGISFAVTGIGVNEDDEGRGGGLWPGWLQKHSGHKTEIGAQTSGDISVFKHLNMFQINRVTPPTDSSSNKESINGVT